MNNEGWTEKLVCACILLVHSSLLILHSACLLLIINYGERCSTESK